jgi:hypothetical protein
MKACAACLRQLAGSDPNKPAIIEDNGLATLMHVMRIFHERSADKAATEDQVKVGRCTLTLGRYWFDRAWFQFLKLQCDTTYLRTTVRRAPRRFT